MFNLFTAMIHSVICLCFRVSRVCRETKENEGREEKRLAHKPQMFNDSGLRSRQSCDSAALSVCAWLFLLSGLLCVKFLTLCLCVPGWQGVGREERSEGTKRRTRSARTGPAVSCGTSLPSTRTHWTDSLPASLLYLYVRQFTLSIMAVSQHRVCRSC